MIAPETLHPPPDFASPCDPVPAFCWARHRDLAAALPGEAGAPRWTSTGMFNDERAAIWPMVPINGVNCTSGVEGRLNWTFCAAMRPMPVSCLMT